MFKILHFIIGRTKKRLNKLKSFKVAKSKDKNLINCGDYDCYGLRIFVRMVVKMMVELILKVVSKSVKIVLKVLVREVLNRKKVWNFTLRWGYLDKLWSFSHFFCSNSCKSAKRSIFWGNGDLDTLLPFFPPLVVVKVVRMVVR